MPLYSFRCLACNKTFATFITISKKIRARKCNSCGGKVIHDFVADHKEGNADSQMREYQFDGSNGTRLYPCAVLPNQIDEARKKNPNVEYREHNGCYLPVVHNRREKLAFLKNNGMVELD